MYLLVHSYFLPENGFQSENYQYLGKFWIVTGTINISNLYNNYTISRAYKKNQDIIFESHNVVLKYKRTTSTKEMNSLESKNKLN